MYLVGKSTMIWSIQEGRIGFCPLFQFPFYGSRTDEYIQCSTIVKYNIPSCNAVIHLIDKVTLFCGLLFKFLLILYIL